MNWSDRLVSALVAMMLWSAAWGGFSQRASAADAPKVVHTVFNVRGWKVHVHPARLPPQSTVGEQVIQLLDQKFRTIEKLAPAAAVRALKEIPFWIQETEVDGSVMAYHPSQKWLEDHDLDGDMAKGIEIRRPEKFLQPVFQETQPFGVLHELAHGYHHHVLGWDNGGIDAAYHSALQSGKYERVLVVRMKGDAAGEVIGRSEKEERAYALSNSHEYFAELSEAYFGRNDFYPFERDELREYDPDGYRVMSLWGSATEE